MREAFMGDFLRSLPGRAFCHVCLAEMLEITFQDALVAVERLGAVGGFTVSPGECFNCQEPRVVARFVQPS